MEDLISFINKGHYLLPPPYQKTNVDYRHYCLIYRQTVEEDPHVESMEAPEL